MRIATARGVFLGLIVSSVVAFATLTAPPATALASGVWTGRVIAESARIRTAPSASAGILDVFHQGQQVTVAGWVSGDEVETQNNTWAELTGGGYMYSAAIQETRPAAPPPVPGGPISDGKWIDANLTLQTLTAYVGDTPVHMAIMSSGRPDYPTPRGVFSIEWRVYNETMDSTTVPWVRDRYRLENVMFTQYFTELGAAIHEAWWKTDESFGLPTSHACMGLPKAEAAWFWEWAHVGVPVYVHE